MEFPELDLIEQELKELEKFKELKEKLPEKEYYALIKKEFEVIHKKYKKLLKQQQKNKKNR